MKLGRILSKNFKMGGESNWNGTYSETGKECMDPAAASLFPNQFNL